MAETSPKRIQKAPKGMVQVEELVKGEFGLESKLVWVTRAEAKKRRKGITDAYLEGLAIAHKVNATGTIQGPVNRVR